MSEPRKLGHKFGCVQYEFDKDELARFREPCQLETFFNKKWLNVDKFDRDQHTLLPYQKVELLYEHIVHKTLYKEIALKHDISDSAAFKTIYNYKNRGRIFNLLPHSSKGFLLKFRTENL